MSALNYTFIWNKDGKTMTLPVKIQKSIEDTWRGENNLICNKCNSKLDQKYICGCGEILKMGEIKKRIDKDTKTIFFKGEYDTFLDNEVVKEINIVGNPIPYSMFNKLYEELKEENRLEIFNNENRFMPVLSKIKETLFFKDLCLLATVGYYKSVIPALVVATSTKLLLIPLRDKRLVRPTNQVGYKILLGNEDLEKVLGDFCIDKNIDKYYEFIKLKQEGKVIEVKEEKQVELPANVDMSILDDLEGEKIAVRVKK